MKLRWSLLGAGLMMMVVGGVQADNYELDKAHTSIVFRVKHLNVSYFYGRFNDVDGGFSIDESNPANSKFDFTIQVESIDTNNEKRDNHLKSPDFFSAKQFPQLTFKSTGVTSAGENMLEVTGDLTCHGVTKSITVNVELTGTGEGPRGEPRAGFEAVFTIKRTDFGMDYMNGPLSDEVKIMFAAEGIAK